MPSFGYENAGFSAHETHYFSAAELSRLILCRIVGFHGGDYEEDRFGQEEVRLTAKNSLQAFTECIGGVPLGDYIPRVHIFVSLSINQMRGSQQEYSVS
jgi:hypothetical protein